MKSMLLAVDFAPIIAPVLEVLNALLWPCIAIVGAVGTIYCIFLGIKIAKSDCSGSAERAVMALHCHCRGGRHDLLHIPRH